MTYTGNPSSSPSDELRFLVQDTSNDPATELLSDAEIAYLLTSEVSTRAAAVEACRVIARRYAGRPGSRSIGDVSISYGDLTARYRLLAEDLATRAARSAVPTPYLGGRTQADKDANSTDLTDHVERAFPDDDRWANASSIGPTNPA